MSQSVAKILVVDSAPEMAALLEEYVEGLGLQVIMESEATQALKKLSAEFFDFLLISERIQGVTALSFLKNTTAISPDTYVILVSSKEDLGHDMRLISRQFRRLPAPLVLEDLGKILAANSNTEDAV